MTRPLGRPPGHACPAPACQVLVPHERFACREHWFALPDDIRHQIARTWANRDRRGHRDAMLAAVRFLAGLVAER